MRLAVVGDLSGVGATDRGGGGRYGIADLAQALARRGHEVRVHTALPHPAGVQPTGVAVDHVPVATVAVETSPELMPAIGEISRHLVDVWRRDTPDVVHCHGWVYGMAAQLAAKKTPVPIVQTFHELSTPGRRESAGGQAATAAKLEALLARNATALTAGCHDDVQTLIRLGCPRAKVSVLSAGVEVDDAVEIESRGGDVPPRIVAVARDFGAEQGLADVVAALPSLGAADLTLVATDPTGPDAGHLGDVARRLRVADRVRMMRGDECPELAALLPSADVVVLPARYEPSSEFVLQAMACGAPVVAFAAGGARDAVIEDVTGLLVQPGDVNALGRAVRTALSQPVLRQGMGLAGRSRARSRYSWDRIATDAEVAYLAAAARHSGQAPAGDRGPGTRGSLRPQSCSPVTRK
uniref:Glycosyl transferase, group 1 n=1 Tax=Mycolicibacterium gilvum (strain PYR-GCK) TaxID=350054 RepID=A4TA43_MYCGI|nr:glycosyl transferase, group 1 [Mycolicibacterium gilvum PYR-GCK]